MKIRIQGNSIRIRLSKTEVSKLEKENYIEEKTVFPSASFFYCLEKESGIETLSATFENNRIVMAVPATFLENWSENSVVGLSSVMPVAGHEDLKLLLEKDFKCLDNITEDQSDNYENPNLVC